MQRSLRIAVTSFDVVTRALDSRPNIEQKGVIIQSQRSARELMRTERAVSFSGESNQRIVTSDVAYCVLPSSVVAALPMARWIE